MKGFYIILVGGTFSAFLCGFVFAQELNLTKASTPETLDKFEAFIVNNAPDEEAFVAVQLVAEPFIKNQQWERAVEIFERYRPLFKNLEQRFAKIIGLLEADEERLVVKNLGPNINTSAGEWDPTPTADGRFLYFTGNGRPDCFGLSDVFVSEFRNGDWQPAINLGSDVNTKEGKETMNNITVDGNRLLLSGTISGEFKMFYIDKTVAGWGEPQLFPKPINSAYYDDGPLITSDSKAMLFVSDRPGGVGEFHKKGYLYHGDYWGNLDIYVCQRTETGWSEEINLGPTINTPYCEYTPFLHPDGKTLYFSSNGHPGLGRLDVFKTVRLKEDSWTEWSEPVNLGKEVNSPDDEWGYKVPTAGDLAYFAAQETQGGYGLNDIYSITLHDIGRPDTVATVSGTVTDGEGRPLEAEILWENLDSGENVGKLRSNPQDGSYFIALPLGKNYGYFAAKEDYFSASKNVDLRNETNPIKITEDIALFTMEDITKTDTTIRINNIFFDLDKYELRKESFTELGRLAQFLNDNPEYEAEIHGHTDSLGEETYNDSLSNKRAQSVVDFLISAGCDSHKLTALGFGEKKPITTNETEDERQQNRRVEFRIIQITVAK